MQWNSASSAIIDQEAEITGVTVLHPEARPGYRTPDWAIFNQQEAEPKAEPKRDLFIDAILSYDVFRSR